MKHSIFTLGAMLAATFALSSCDDSVAIVEPASKGIPFEVSTLLTKTTNDGLSTSWASGDAINLFHAEAGATNYTSDGEFTVDESLTGKFSGTLASALDADKSYDWYANYPYTSQVATPANTSKGWITVGGTSQTQTGNDSMTHLAGTACPLYGVVKEVASNVKPAIAMKHLASVVAVKVTNTLEEDLTVSSVSFTSTEDIVGTYYVNYAGDTPSYKGSGDAYVSKTANLTVTGGTAIAQNASAVFFIAIKPHKAASGSTLKISVNGVEKTLTLPKDVTFTAGSIKTLAYEYEGSKVTGQALPFEEDFNAYTYSSSASNLEAKVSDYSNFTAFTKVYGGDADGVLRIGASSSSGSMVTVPLDLSSESTVIVKAKKFSSDNTAVRITVNEVNYDTAKLSADYQDYYIYLPAIGNYAAVTVTSDIQKRYYIDNIQIVSGKVTPPLPPVITPESTSVSLEYNDEAVHEIGVTVTGQDGDVSCGVYDDADDGTAECSWCVASYEEGKVSCTAEANLGSTARTAYIILSATNSDGTTKSVITLIQEAKPSASEKTVEITNWNTLFGTSYTGSISSVKKDSLTLTGTSDDVTIKVTNGTSTNGYVADADFRMYNGYTFTVSVPEGKKLTKITATKATTNKAKKISGVAFDTGTCTIATDGSSLSWVSTSSTQEVKLSITDTMGFGTMSITYE